MMERLFVDTSAWYALANRADTSHQAVTRLLREWEGRLVTTDYVFDELVTLVRARVGHQMAVRVGELVLHGRVAAVVDVEPEDWKKAWEIFRRDEDKLYSFTDCTSFAVMQRLGIVAGAALDDHFRQAGFTTLPQG